MVCHQACMPGHPPVCDPQVYCKAFQVLGHRQASHHRGRPRVPHPDHLKGGASLSKGPPDHLKCCPILCIAPLSILLAARSKCTYYGPLPISRDLTCALCPPSTRYLSSCRLSNSSSTLSHLATCYLPAQVRWLSLGPRPGSRPGQPCLCS